MFESCILTLSLLSAFQRLLVLKKWMAMMLLAGSEEESIQVELTSQAIN